MNVCDVREQVPEMTLTTVSGITTVLGAFAVSQTNPHCAVTGKFLTQVKFLGTYVVPKVGVQVAATYRSLPGPNIVANYVADNSVISRRSAVRSPPARSTRRSISIEPAQLYRQPDEPDRPPPLEDPAILEVSLVYQPRSLQPVQLERCHLATTTLLAWLTPTGIHLARFAKFSLQFDF